MAYVHPLLSGDGLGLHHCATCEVSQAPGQEFGICSGCRRVSYCCKEHQRLHWKTHKKHCKKEQIARQKSPIKTACWDAVQSLCPGGKVAVTSHTTWDVAYVQVPPETLFRLRACTKEMQRAGQSNVFKAAAPDSLNCIWAGDVVVYTGSWSTASARTASSSK